MSVLIVALVLTPVLLAVVIRLAGHARPVLRGAWLVMVALAASASVMSMTVPDLTVALGLTPWNSQVGLSFGRPASFLLVFVYWSIILSFIAPIWRPTADGPPKGIDLTWCLCGAICAGLLVNDLLARVVILDLVSVLVIILLLVSSPSDRTRFSVIWHYVVLRLGDMGFLLVALLLAQLSDSMSIGAAFGLSADLVGPQQQIVLVIAGLLAVWIKLGLAPASGWLRAACDLPVPQRALVLSGGPPLLGVYLLYRLQPTLAAMDSTLAVVVWAIVALMALASLVMIARPGQPKILRCATLHSVLALVACLTQTLVPYLLSFVPVRLALALALRDAAPHTETLDETRSPALPGRLSAMVASTACVEARLDGAVAALCRSPHRLGAWLQHYHTGKLRLNLLWPVLGLIPFLLALLVSTLGQRP